MDTLNFRKNRAAAMPNPTAAYRIFFHRFVCHIRRIHLLTDVYLNDIGVPSTGDKKVDQSLLREEVPVYLTIAEMVRFFNEGASVKVERREDTITIYETIKEHLHDWEKELKHSINPRGVPTDDLVAIDDFAASLWLVARKYITEPIETASLFKLLNDVGKGTQLTRARYQLATQNKKDNEPVEHNPFKNTLIEYEKMRGKFR